MRPTFQTDLLNSKTVVSAAAAALALGVSAQPVYAQPDRAEAAMQAGNGPEAEAAHSITLQSDPNNLKALVGRGTARAWQKNWSGAISDLNRALAIDPNNLEALVALGYANAWSGQYASAESNFQRALALAPDSQSAKKGLAYSAYWAGRNEDAAQQFEKLVYEIPDDPEPLVGVGMARLANGNAGRAAKAYKSALAIDPAREDAKKGLTAAYDYPALAELSVWGGTTSGGGDAGLSLGGLASWVTP